MYVEKWDKDTYKDLLENNLNGYYIKFFREKFDDGFEYFNLLVGGCKTLKQQKYIIHDFVEFCEGKGYNKQVDEGYDERPEEWKEEIEDNEEDTNIGFYYAVFVVYHSENENEKDDFDPDMNEKDRIQTIINIYKEWIEKFRKETTPIKLGKRKTKDIVYRYYQERIDFWKKIGDERLAIDKAYGHDIKYFDIKYNPYSLIRKELLNPIGIEDACKEITQDYYSKYDERH